MPHAALAENALVDDGDLWRRREVDVAALTLDYKSHRQAGAHQRRFLKRFKAIDRISVNRLYEIASLKASGRGRGAGLDPTYARYMLDTAESHEHAGENDKGEDEIGDGPGEHNR